MYFSVATHSSRVSEGLYRDILSGILAGKYPPKSTLPTESRLARNYGVSRSIVRSALQVLKQQGVVESHQGSGTVVADSDPHQPTLSRRKARLRELRECFACRLAIEPEIAARLAQVQSPKATAYLRAQLHGVEGQLGGDFRADTEHSARDADFHVKLAEFSGNVFFSEIMISLRPYVIFSMNFGLNLSESAQQSHISLSLMEHRTIIAATLKCDTGAARILMREHIANARDRIFTAC